MRNLGFAFLIGLILGVAIVAYAGSRQYASLKTYADSVAKADAAKDSASHAFSDSVQLVVAQLQAKKQKIITKVVADTSGIAEAESLFVSAQTARDSMKDLESEVNAYRGVTKGLFAALAISDSIIQAEKARGDSLQHTVDALNVDVQSLTSRINKLHGTPKWLSISFEALKIGGAAYAGYKVGERRH